MGQPNSWLNPQTGPTAGDWFDPTNWSSPFVPIASDVAQINNGGEAVADSSTAMGAAIDVNRLEVGKNSGTGRLTVTGVALNMGVDLDIGEIGGGVATGPVFVTSNGSATITDAANVLVGTSGNGDIDIGPASATLGAEANATGSLTIERVPTVTVPDNVEIGRAGGTATASATGTLHLTDASDRFEVGQALLVGDTGPTVGVKNSTGTLILESVSNLMVGDHLLVGSIKNAGGQDTTNSSASLTSMGSISIGNNLDVAMASVTGGGVANATGTLNIQTADNLSVDNLVGIGHVRSTAGSGQATVTAIATIQDISTVLISKDLFVGRSNTRDNVVGMANGTLTLERSTSVTIGADLDVGQASTSGPSVPLGGSTASSQGTGNAVLRDIGTLTIGTLSMSGGDIDIGSTSSGAVNSTSEGNGTLLLERIGTLEVATDLDVGQVSGSGQSTGTGNLTIRQTPSITVGDDFEIGRTSGSAGGVNTGQGTVSISDATISVGFADPLLPGSLSVGDAIAELNQQASATGNATFQNVTMTVADKVSVGTLAGGSTNGLIQANGSLHLVASSITAPQLDVATVFAGTAGTAQGSLHLDPSLITVSGAMTLGAGATLSFGLAGTTRADGTDAAGQYSTIDTDGATLAGILDIELLDDFIPAAGDTFQIIGGALNGSQFDTVIFPTLSGLAWDITYQPTAVWLEILADGFTADFNTDGQVDDADLSVWQASFDTNAGADADGDGDSDGNDFLAWQRQFGSGTPSLLSSTQAVPEPATWMLLLLAVAGKSRTTGRAGGLRKAPKRGWRINIVLVLSRAVLVLESK